MKVCALSKTRPTVLKIGGSVITDKREELRPRTDIIDRLATEIQKASIKSLIIVHGGGSFGHPKAKQYAIKEGFKEKLQKIGFCETHHVMTMLNGLLMDALLWHKIPAISVTPSSVITTKKGRIHSFEEVPLRKLLEMGFLPVMYGDAVLDTELGFTILSGDQLISAIATRLNAERIIIGSDVNGLYDIDPKTEEEARMFEHLTLEEAKKLHNSLGDSRAVDVTGGMLGKIAEILPAVEQQIPVTILNASIPDCVYKALKGDKVKGTLIQKE
jgi:isopentenyl phosphate kinase